MSIIVPLSNENYYKLHLDNYEFSNELIIKTFEIIKLNTYEHIDKKNNPNQNSNSYKKIIYKIIELIKKSNNIGVFNILINILPYPIWIEWFKSCFILKYYWDDELIKKIQDSNKMNIIACVLDLENLKDLKDFKDFKDFEDIDNLNLTPEQKNIYEKKINILDSHLINLSNSYDFSYNFIGNIIKKRIEYLKNILCEYLENFSLENYLGSDNIIFLLGLNKLFKYTNSNDNNTCDNFINITKKIKNTKIILTLYPKKKCGFKLKHGINYISYDDYICIFIDNLIIQLHKKIFNQYNIFGISNGYIDFDSYNIKVNSLIYQKFNLELNDIFNDINTTDEYNKIILDFNKNYQNNTDNQILKASQQTWFKSTIQINIQKTIKYNLLKCYECKKTYNYSLPDYKFHCLNCGIKNWKWREEKVNLSGYTFFITGIRVKIGFSTALRLLRSGSIVIGTTRYPNFALYNYSKEYDFEIWKSRLIIIQADFLNLDSVYDMLDIIDQFRINGFINMAFRTIRPSEYYTDSVNQIESELKKNVKFIENQNSNINITNSNINNSENKSIQIKPNTTKYFTDLNQLNTSQIIKYKPNQSVIINKFNDVQEIPHENSWEQTIDQVEPKEIVECIAINQLVPTLIINKIKTKLIGPNKFIIHVGSFEGQFDTSKSNKHIHTNMCKSALNMLIRSLEEDPDPNLHVHTINPGYVTGAKINPIGHEFPLSMEDGASRITWPIYQVSKGIKLDKTWIKIGNYEKTKW